MVADRTLKCKIRIHDDDDGDDDSGSGCNDKQRKPTHPYNARESDIVIRDTCRKITEFTVCCLFYTIPELHQISKLTGRSMSHVRCNLKVIPIADGANEGKSKGKAILVRGRVQKFPARHTKAAPNGKRCEGYTVPSMVRLMYQLKSVLK